MHGGGPGILELGLLAGHPFPVLQDQVGMTFTLLRHPVCIDA
jgi:hypothetical protein